MFKFASPKVWAGEEAFEELDESEVRAAKNEKKKKRKTHSLSG